MLQHLAEKPNGRLFNLAESSAIGQWRLFLAKLARLGTVFSARVGEIVLFNDHSIGAIVRASNKAERY